MQSSDLSKEHLFLQLLGQTIKDAFLSLSVEHDADGCHTLCSQVQSPVPLVQNCTWTQKGS